MSRHISRFEDAAPGDGANYTIGFNPAFVAKVRAKRRREAERRRREENTRLAQEAEQRRKQQLEREAIQKATGVVGPVKQLAFDILQNHYRTWDDVFGPSRKRDIVFLRQAIIHAARTKWGEGVSFPKLGRIFDRDHTTTLHNYRVVQEAIDDGTAERMVSPGGEIYWLRTDRLGRPPLTRQPQRGD